MEDAATAEISRTQVWQWLRHPRGRLADGRHVTFPLVRKIIEEELGRIRHERGEARFNGGHFPQANRLFAQLIESETLEPFFTLKAYPLLNGVHEAPMSEPDFLPDDRSLNWHSGAPAISFPLSKPEKALSERN
jgi:hypothetical protein